MTKYGNKIWGNEPECARQHVSHISSTKHGEQLLLRSGYGFKMSRSVPVLHWCSVDDH